MTKIFLLFSAVMLYFVGAFYGINPIGSVGKVFQLLILPGSDTEHVFRAVMGIYWGLATLFVVGAVNDRYTRPALIALIVFMLGAAIGRLLGLAIDGMPDAQFLKLSIVLELSFGLSAIHFLRKGDKLG